jgi:hypothetical protein
MTGDTVPMSLYTATYKLDVVVPVVVFAVVVDTELALVHHYYE